MQISFYSILMAAGWSSFFILLLSIFRIWEDGKMNYSATPLTVILLGCILRCSLPLDFPGFTQPISSTGVYALVDEFLGTPVIQPKEPSFYVTPLMIFVLVWIVGAVGAVLFLSIRYVVSMKKIDRCTPNVEPVVYDIAEEICEEWGINHFFVVRTTGVDVPQVCGIRYPRILLPNKHYTEAEYRYILMHELTHWRNRDMVMRALSNLICCAFWWNPFVYLLQFRLTNTLEYKCDAAMLYYLADDERSGYLKVIHKELYSEKKKRDKAEGKAMTVPMGSDLVRPMSEEHYRKRADIIMHHKPDKKRERRLAIYTAAVMAVLMVFSYRYIIQPYFYVPEEEFTVAAPADGMGIDELTADNGYLVLEEDGFYSVYIDNEYFCTVNSESAEVFVNNGFAIRNSTDKGIT